MKTLVTIALMLGTFGIYGTASATAETQAPVPQVEISKETKQKVSPVRRKRPHKNGDNKPAKEATKDSSVPAPAPQ